MIFYELYMIYYNITLYIFRTRLQYNIDILYYIINLLVVFIEFLKRKEKSFQVVLSKIP